MVLRQIRFLHTPIKLIRADFESHTTNKKVVSSIQLKNLGMDLLTTEQHLRQNYKQKDLTETIYQWRH